MDLSAERDAEIGREVFGRLRRLAGRLAERHGIPADRASDFILTGSLFVAADLNDCDLAGALRLAQELVRSVMEDELPEETRH
ncbi:MAG: hypothetical protein V2I82_16370 [Halieaceae bacterium]|jgi:hypothetical protein|nr:hypothetical protein [Halieaceae bacterium]